MTTNAKAVLNYLKQAGPNVWFNTKQVQEALGFEQSGAVTGSIRGLETKGFAKKEKREEEVDGKTKTVSYFCLTPEGMDYNPDEAE